MACNHATGVCGPSPNHQPDPHGFCEECDGSGSCIPPAASSYTLVSSSPVTAGVSFSVAVTVKDQFLVPYPSYTGTVHFTSTDAQAILPADTTLTNGVGTFNITLETYGPQTITATDTIASTITGNTGGIGVYAGPADHLVLTLSGPVTATVASTMTVTAQDAYNNLAAGYGGTVHFTSTDGTAILPADSTLTSGTGSFGVTFETLGSQSITGTDTVTSTINGTSNTVTVNPVLLPSGAACIINGQCMSNMCVGGYCQ